MDLTVTIVMLVPVILAVALIVGVVRKNITERSPGDPVDITGAIPAVIVLMVAVIIIGSMGASISPYSWDEDSGELTINMDVGSGSQDWDSYGTDVKSLIINDNVSTVADGAFDTLTGLEYVSISESVESITSSAFGVTLKDYLDQTITAPEAGEYYGFGDGELFLANNAVLNIQNGTLRGLATGYTAAKNIVVPETYNGTAVTGTSSAAFMGTSLENVVIVGDSFTTLAYRSFRECSSLEKISTPDSITSVGGDAFNSCPNLLSLSFKNLETLGNAVFYGDTSLTSATFESLPETLGTSLFNECTSLTSMDVPDGVVSIGNNFMLNCSSATTITMPDSVSILGSNDFAGCTGIESVTFGSGLTTIGTNALSSWTFYDSDGTTELDKTVASNLAGFTFQGTASALVKVLPDRSALTTEQTLQVQELTKKAALTETKTLLLDETEIFSVEEKELASA